MFAAKQASNRDQTPYKQCQLTRKTKDGGITVDVAWIPAKFAIQGKYLEIKGINGWLVEAAGETTLPGSVVDAQSRDYKNTRIASDVKRGTREQYGK